MPNKKIQIIFRQIGGIWQSINEQKPRMFADFLDLYNIIFDDRTHFMRLKYYCERDKLNREIEIQYYGGTIQCDICETKEQQNIHIY